MAIEASFVDEVGDKIEGKIEEKIEEEGNDKVGDTNGDKVYEKNIAEKKNKIDPKNSCNLAIKRELKKSNFSITRFSTWIATRKNIRIIVVTLLFLCLYFTMKSMTQPSRSILHKDNHLDKIISPKNTLATLVSSLRVTFDEMNKRLNKKYHHLQDWLHEDVKNEKSSIATTSSSLHHHEEWPNIKQDDNIKSLKVIKEDHDLYSTNLLHDEHEDNNDSIIKNYEAIANDFDYNNANIKVTIPKMTKNIENDIEEIYENSNVPHKNEYKSYVKVIDGNEKETNFDRGLNNNTNEDLSNNTNGDEDLNYNVNKDLNYNVSEGISYYVNDEVKYNANGSFNNVDEDLTNDVNKNLDYNVNRDLNSNGLNNYLYFESNKWNDSYNTMNTDNTSKNEKSNEKPTNNVETHFGKTLQYTKIDKSSFSNLVDNNHVGSGDRKNYLNEELHLNYNKDASFGRQKNDLDTHINNMQKIDDHASKSSTIDLHLNENFDLVHGHEMKSNYNDNDNENFVENTSMVHGLFDNLIGAKEQIRNVGQNNLRTPHEIINTSINPNNFNYGYSKNVKSHINNKNIVNIKMSEEIVEEIMKPLVNDQLDKLYNNVDQIKHLEHVKNNQNIMENNGQNVVINPTIEEGHYPLNKLHEMIHVHVSSEPSNSSIEIENTIEYDQNISYDKNNMKKSFKEILDVPIQNIDESQGNKKVLLNSKLGPSEEEHLEKQTKEIEIGIDNKNNNKLDKVNIEEGIT